MEMHAYYEDYVPSAQRILGDMFDFANLTVTVLEMNGRRVSKVEIIVKEKQDTDEQ